MSEVLNHFLKYVSYDTESKEDVEEFPSTESQRVLAEVLAEELRAMHAQELIRICHHTGHHGQEGSGNRLYRSYGYGSGLLRCQCTPADCKTV